MPLTVPPSKGTPTPSQLCSGRHRDLHPLPAVNAPELHDKASSFVWLLTHSTLSDGAQSPTRRPGDTEVLCVLRAQPSVTVRCNGVERQRRPARAPITCVAGLPVAPALWPVAPAPHPLGGGLGLRVTSVGSRQQETTSRKVR